ncbi:MAG: arylsulfatase, partial [Pirellulaceae bacterium]|nr:arylsulfatase [Pirellulaceae bacterium]
TKYSQARTGLELYDLDADVGETTNIASEHPEIVKRLQQLGEKMRDELGDSRTKRQGKGVRPAGQVAG